MAEGLVPAFSPPTEEQRRALRIAAAYLQRAGTEAATRLLPVETQRNGQTVLMLELRNNLRAASSLCETLIDVFDGWPPNVS